jgi:hypothetical protein
MGLPRGLRLYGGMRTWPRSLGPGSPGDERSNRPPCWGRSVTSQLAGLEKEIKRVAKGSSGKKTKKSEGKKKSSRIEKSANKLLK